MKALDGIEAVLVDVLPDLRGVIRHRVHHFAIGLREPDVVLEEIAVAVDVGHHDLLVDEMIALQQIRVARVIVDDHFVDLVQAVRVALVEPLVLHAELPVGIAVRKSAIGRDHVHLFEVEDFEERLVEVEAVFARIRFDLSIEPRQFGCETLPAGWNGDRHGYLPFPRKSLIDW